MALDRFDDPTPTNGQGRVRRTSNSLARCACGHPREAHTHYRRGRDCGACPCPRYRRGAELCAELRAVARLFCGLIWDELRR